MTGALNYLVRMSCDLESNIVAVERVKEYSECPVEVCTTLVGVQVVMLVLCSLRFKLEYIVQDMV